MKPFPALSIMIGALDFGSVRFTRAAISPNCADLYGSSKPGKRSFGRFSRPLLEVLFQIPCRYESKVKSLAVAEIFRYCKGFRLSYSSFCLLDQKYKRGVIQQVFAGRKGTGKACYPEWQQSSLGEYFTEQTIRTSNTPSTPLVSLTVEDGITPKTGRYYREFLVTKEGENYKMIKPGWFAYNPMNAHLGAIAPNHLGYTAAVSGYYNIFSVNEPDTICFWEEYLTSYSMLIYYKLIATGSLIEKQRVHYSQFVRIRRCLPSVEEQKHLSKLFETLNKKIANAESTERRLVGMRVSFLQQLFI